MATEIVTAGSAEVQNRQWGNREEIDQTAKRIQEMLPGQKLSYENALSVAQYAKLTGLNPFRGEFYAYEARGRLVLVDGYKALTRWAREQCAFTDSYEPLGEDEMPENGTYGYRCSILREDAIPILQALVKCGIDFQEAFDKAASTAVGVVTRADTASREPPTGWTWDQVARKRALKNALNISHGAPDLHELARRSWNVNGTETIEADWEDVTATMSMEERERLAALTAQGRQHQAEQEPITAENAEEILSKNRAILHGDSEDADWDAETSDAGEEEPEPQPKPKAKAATNGRPLEPDKVRGFITLKIAQGTEVRRTTPITDGHTKSIVDKLQACFAGQPDADLKRHSVTGWLIGKESVKDFVEAEYFALLDWLVPKERREYGTWDLHPAAYAEAAAILKEALKDAGQKELPL